MKKFTAFMLSGMIGLSSFASAPYIIPDTTPVYAADSYTSGNYQGMIYRKYDNQVVISGSESGLSGALTIPDTIDGLPVTAILSKSFYGQKDITSVSIPASIALIGDEAFNLVDLKPSESFHYTDTFAKLTEINVDPNNKYYASIDGVLYSKDISLIIQYPYAKKDAFTVPQTVKSIKSHAFDYCALSSVTLPEGITEIPDSGFLRCVYLKSINIPNTVTKIGQRAFQNTALESIVLPPSVATIGIYAFYESIPLNTITIENPQCKIPDYYSLCNTRKDSTYTGTIRGYDGSYAQAFALKYNYNFESLGSPSETTQAPATTATEETTTTTTEETTTTATEETTTTTTAETTTTTTATEETASSSTTTTTTTEIPWYETSATTTTTTEIPWYATSTTTTTRYIEWWETSTTTESTTTTTTASQTTTTTTAYVPVTTTTKAPEKVAYYVRFIDDSNGNTLSGVKYRVYSFDSNDEDYGEMISDNNYTLFNFYSDSFDIEILELPNGYVLDEPALRTFIHSGRNVEIRIKKDYSPVTETTASTTASASTTQTQTTASPVTTASETAETSPYVTETTAAPPANTKTTYYIRFVDAENNNPVSGIRYRIRSANNSDPDYGEKISSEFQESFDFFSDSFTIQMLYVPDEYSYETVEPLTYTNARRILTVRVKKKSELPQETTTAAPETQTTASQTETSTTSAETTTTAPVIDPPHGITLGDVDGNGIVDASDASEVLTEYALLSTSNPSHFTEEQKKAADVNGDGASDASDASCILAYYAYRSTGGSKDIETFLRENSII